MATCRDSTPAPGLRRVRSSGGAHARLLKAAQLLDVEVKKLARRLQGAEAVEMVTAQHPGERGFGDWQHQHDLSVGPALAAQGEDLRLKLRAGLARLAARPGRAIRQMRWKPRLSGSLQPTANRLFAHRKNSSGSAKGAMFSGELANHFGSHQRGQSGISVHSVREE